VRKKIRLSLRWQNFQMLCSCTKKKSILARRKSLKENIFSRAKKKFSGYRPSQENFPLGNLSCENISVGEHITEKKVFVSQQMIRDCKNILCQQQNCVCCPLFSCYKTIFFRAWELEFWTISLHPHSKKKKMDHRRAAT